MASIKHLLASSVALPLLFAASAAAAQTAAPETISVAPGVTPADTIDFSADRVTYDDASSLVVAEGRVRMNRDGYYVASDRVEWDRTTGKVVAVGNVVILSPQGDHVIGNRVLLDDKLSDGTIEDLLVVLESGGRIAAKRATRTNGVLKLEQAIYTPCPVTTPSGCPRRPSWTISAARVTRDPVAGRLRFESGRLTLFGISLPLLPVFNVSDGSNDHAANGLLIPNVSVSSSNGLEVGVPYYRRLGDNKDLTLTPHLYTKALPAAEARFRHLTDFGAYQLGGFVTYGKIESTELVSSSSNSSTRRGFRGYFEGNGKFQFSPAWSLTSSLRVATDKTVTRRYDLTRDALLRNFVEAERITPNAYVSIAGWAFEGLRAEDVQKRIPIALPAIDARLRLADPWLGGTVELEGNSLAILRLEGQDTQRAFASARWDLRKLTRGGQELTLTAYARGDVYHSNAAGLNDIAYYRGSEGWQARGIGALAADLRYPLIGPAFGGTQRIVPRVQIVLTPPTRNLSIPNEDARAVDLEDSNLFALNRFPGYDRWEDGSRITYGAEYMLDRGLWSLETIVGQSYRLTRSPSIFPDGTGLTDRLSDIVGRTRLRYGRFIDITHRFRVDKDNLAVRRNELDVTLGTNQSYLQVGYLRLNRNIAPAIEDLRDKEEIRAAGRVRFLRYWSVFAATVFDLTSTSEDPTTNADGFQPVRLRMGLNYSDDCIDLGVSWKRDYERIGDFRKGSTVSFTFSLKGLGR